MYKYIIYRYFAKKAATKVEENGHTGTKITHNSKTYCNISLTKTVWSTLLSRKLAALRKVNHLLYYKIRMS